MDLHNLAAILDAPAPAPDPEPVRLARAYCARPDPLKPFEVAFWRTPRALARQAAWLLDIQTRAVPTKKV